MNSLHWGNLTVVNKTQVRKITKDLTVECAVMNKCKATFGQGMLNHAGILEADLGKMVVI